MNNSVVKKILTSVAIVCVLIVSAIPSYAYTDEKKSEIVSPVEVKYLGQLNAQPVFQVNINNAKGEDLYMVLKDGDGNSLYSEKFNHKTFSRKFQFAKDDTGEMKVTMSLVSKSEKRSQEFEINKVVHVVEDVVVTKLD
jgi:hypothetical protein